MNTQQIFKYHFSQNIKDENFFVNQTNQIAYDTTLSKNFEQNIFLYGPKKSGKTQLINTWSKYNDAIIYKDNFSEILNLKKNIAIDDVFDSISEENLFHIINHCGLYNLKIYLSSSCKLTNYNFQLKDLSSRIKAFYFLNINMPDDEMCKMLMTKLFSDKQIIIKNKEIFDFILNRVNRTYNDIFLFIEKIDSLSLEKKRQLTIPLIKEIL